MTNDQVRSLVDSRTSRVSRATMGLEQEVRHSSGPFRHEGGGIYAQRCTEVRVDEHEPIPLAVILGVLEPLMREIGCRIGNQYD